MRAIPQHKDRDRLLFSLLYTTGMRIGEALAIDVDDLDLTPDDEHVTVLAKGGRRRTILLDDPTLVSLLRRYLKARGYRHGPLFRAEKNHVGGPLRYASAQQLWSKYRTKAHVDASIHQLRHAHATELVNAGVSLETIRRRLGHYAGDLVKWIMSGSALVESGEQSVEDLLATELSFVDGVVSLGLQGGAELDGALEEGAGLTDRFEVTVQPDWSGAVAVAEHAAVHLGAQPAHFGAFGVGGQFFGGVVERFDLLADGEVLVGDGAIGDA